MVKISEEKELLLKDLYARLPYKVKFKADNEECIREIHYIKDENVYIREYRNLPYWIDNIKPYLRSMSSMTEEEKKEYGKVCELDTEILANHPMNGEPFPALYNSQDWLNKKMFAYRTLDGKDMFELGLALKAPEGMYKTVL